MVCYVTVADFQQRLGLDKLSCQERVVQL